MSWADFRYRLSHRWAKLQLAARYATGTLNADQAQDMMIALQSTAGWHMVNTLCEEDVLEQATQFYVDTPELRAVIAYCCEVVSSKYDYSLDPSPSSDAFDLLAEKAAVLGLELQELTEVGGAVQLPANAEVEDAEEGDYE